MGRPAIHISPLVGASRPPSTAMAIMATGLKRQAKLSTFWRDGLPRMAEKMEMRMGVASHAMRAMPKLRTEATVLFLQMRLKSTPVPERAIMGAEIG